MRYRELGLLAEGGMALVHKAVGEDGCAVVIKRVRPPFCFDASYLKLFEDEGAVHEALHHPNIVRLVERGADDAGPFLVFEHVDGVDLSRALEHLAATGSRMTLEMALAVLIPVSRALAAAHSACAADGATLALVHRDVSPGNVLIGTDGTVKLADFGVAASALRQEATVAGEMKGKFAYMAPEQTRGEKVGPKADLFSLGIVAWEALAGARLFDGPTDADVVHAVREQVAPPLESRRPDLPMELCTLVNALLNKAEGSRPENAASVTRGLEAIALAHGLEEGLSRHASRLARDVPRRDVVARDVDLRRRTQRVLGADTATTGVVVVRSRTSSFGSLWRAAAVLVPVVVVGAALGVAMRRPEPVTPLPDVPVSASPVVVAAAPVAAPTPTTVPSPSPVAEPSTATAPGFRSADAATVDVDVAIAKVSDRPRVKPPRPARAGVDPSADAAASATVSAAKGSTEPLAGAGVGFVSVSSEPWAQVFVDGRLVAKETPVAKLALPVGRHQIRLVNPVYKLERQIAVDVAADRHHKEHIDLNAP